MTKYTDTDADNSQGRQQEEKVLDGLERRLTGLSQSLLELGVAASQVNGAENDTDTHTHAHAGADADANTDTSTPSPTSTVVSEKVQQSMHHLAHIDTLRRHTTTRVPLEAIDHVDQGKNPNLYTKEYIEQVAGENMFMNGKLSTIKTYHDMLAVALSENFTELSQVVESGN
ncbi:hypothetical protein E3P92_01804 [Wallemia ichthyophaga]|uniref:Mediator of RNA polymerase II transcription subunit 10 n=2 Tax=Wallemia ichthyophaga TaxID=245174 RepID=A0A4T0LEC0_WALIC|nr:Mediator of RNA polymerase II transcription subunit 10 [Wallemia ichthyophaga EXF-994]TIA73083.1 hypothetical protein E3P91_01625 [Wallemia ichthyophaga]EOQ99049.1 Mediator of RNA polymerase II transcription subunit 10 [Wallemia ichthyophaga EXF-994]TIA83855.1 hypothetical protein E3P98_00463 [Wallemia ichthyophaga]TIA90397.1 hypothetical protein E3P97_02572 [Wallemia ichthyophaga]TIB14820.1 hypothetical protein E3P92_01804 [Wallemia ichthyophaga]